MTKSSLVECLPARIVIITEIMSTYDVTTTTWNFVFIELLNDSNAFLVGFTVLLRQWTIFFLSFQLTQIALAEVAYLFWPIM